MELASVLVHENERCLLAESPVGVPLLTRDRMGSEGFIPWLLRHQKLPVVEGAWARVDVAGRRFVMLPKGAVSATVPAIEVVNLSRESIGLRHPWISETLPLRDSKDLPDQLSPEWLSPESTNAYRWDLLWGHTRSGGVATRLAEAVLYQSERRPSAAEVRELKIMGAQHGLHCGYWKFHERGVQRKGKAELCPEWLWGEADRFGGTILESGIAYRVDFREGYSYGLFLDQRENRHRLLSDFVESGFSAFPCEQDSPPSVLNTFAYTCGFSVCAAKAGARVVSVDLSKKYLAWGEENFRLNGLDPGGHEFLYGDVFGWVKRFRRRDRRFDLIILDPPTFSRSKEGGVFRVKQDLGSLVEGVVPLLTQSGRLLVSSNASTWAPGEFVTSVRAAVRRAGYRVGAQCFAVEPWDFGVVTPKTSYLKSLWIEVLGGRG